MKYTAYYFLWQVISSEKAAYFPWLCPVNINKVGRLFNIHAGQRRELLLDLLN